MFLNDFVPDWTGIPAGLFITTKLLLSSIIKSISSETPKKLSAVVAFAGDP